MKVFILSILAVLFLANSPVMAGVEPDESQLLVPPPMLDPPNPDGARCFSVVNRAPYTVTGSIVSNYATDALTRQKVRQTINFRLAPGRKENYCTYGPYYPGTRLGFMIRTIVPVFSCYTVPQGTIEIMGEYVKGQGSRSWINCQ